MAVEIRRPTDEEFPAVCHADGRAFGVGYTDEEIEQRRVMHDMSRFRIALDGGRIVAAAGSYALDATLPGGASVPMGGVTWVATAATHRRQGLMRRVVGAVHDDIDQRGEPLATLNASEGGIYEHLGYGIATRVRVTTIDPRLTRMKREFRVPPGAVRYLEGEEIVPVIAEIWDRYRRTRAGEIAVEEREHRYFCEQRSRQEAELSPAAYLAHRDGFAIYRTKMRWNDGQPAHELTLVQLAAVTDEAHAALWQTLLATDLVGSITSRTIAVDDALPFLLENQRALRTTAVNDGVWCNARDVAVCFGARTYRTADRLVVEADGTRWAIEGGPEGGACKPVKTKPDIVTSHGWLSALLYGGVLPSSLVAGRRMTARNDAAVQRADLFFPTSLAPHCQSMY